MDSIIGTARVPNIPIETEECHRISRELIHALFHAKLVICEILPFSLIYVREPAKLGTIHYDTNASSLLDGCMLPGTLKLPISIVAGVAI